MYEKKFRQNVPAPGEGDTGLRKCERIAEIAVIARDRRDRKNNSLPLIFADRRGSKSLSC
jgi:hypothetical protein